MAYFTYAGAFSGIGGLELAAEHLGGEPVFMCESEPFCQRVLKRRFPGVPLFSDVREVRGSEYADRVDVFVFGFPCQDVSGAGRGAGIKGERSGLWKEGFRLISEMRPKIVLIENVAMLRSRGLDVVLNDLDSIGYHAEWDIISAAAVGAPHLRERVWIVARPAELAEQPVYGELARDRKKEIKTFGFVGKLPRAGRMGKELHELVPLAPRKTTRQDGRSYWTGVNLLGHSGSLACWPTPDGSVSQLGEGTTTWLEWRERLKAKGNNGNGAGIPLTIASLLDAEGKRSYPLWPTSTARDYKDTGDLSRVPENALLPRVVQRVERQNNPRRVEGTSAISNDSGFQTSFGVARGDLRLARTVSHRHTGRGPQEPDFTQQMWRTPCAPDGSGGGMVPVARVAQGHTLNLGDQVWSGVGTGSLNPTWVEWLMGLPLWWTDPNVHSSFVTPVGWEIEPLLVAPRTSSGIAFRVPRLKACGNAVVWQCAWYALARAVAATPQVWRDE